jgi:hypothetical protein
LHLHQERAGIPLPFYSKRMLLLGFIVFFHAYQATW